MKSFALRRKLRLSALLAASLIDWKLLLAITWSYLDPLFPDFPELLSELLCILFDRSESFDIKFLYSSC